MSFTGKCLLINSATHIFSGDDINLTVGIESQENRFIKEIFLNFRGEIKVRWEDLISKSKDGKIIYIMQVFEDQQIILNRHIALQTMNVLNKGMYHYNVLLNIPRELPQSVNRKYGSVKYELELGICYANVVEILCKIPIDIKRRMNICLHKDYMWPSHTVYKKIFCCNFQLLKVFLNLPTTCFMTGETINYFVKIENFSQLVRLQRLSVILSETHYYKAFKPKERTKQVHITLNQVMHLFKGSNCSSKIEGTLKLPQNLVPPSPSNCYLNTSYNLHFILVFTRFFTDGYLTLPIKIGSHRDNMRAISNFTSDDTKLQIEFEKSTEYEV